MRILCVYYSWKGHTAKVAERLADLLHVSPVRIEPAVESGMFGKAMKALLGMSSPIKPVKEDLSDIDVLVIASPVWAGKVPPYVNEYINRMSMCEGKRCYVLVEMGNSGADKAIGHLKGRLESKGMKFAGSTWTIEKDVDADMVYDHLISFAETIHGKKIVLV
ncbi:MAG: NAD(P)H-dependent oxidoreductase [Methanomicrobiales archaeon]|nr:NAD(P)H-dependent oxidoreductase [Methanomicrobiales archaeon]